MSKFNYRKLEVRDNTIEQMLNDGFINKNDFLNSMGLGGVAVFRDRAGNVLLRKKNLVTLRGRIFTLNKLFTNSNRNVNDAKLNVPFDPRMNDNGVITDFNNVFSDTPAYDTNKVQWNASNYITNDVDRQICLFRIGKGGANWTPEGWEIVTNQPVPTNTALIDPIVFRNLEDTNPGADGETIILSTDNSINYENIYPSKEINGTPVCVNDSTGGLCIDEENPPVGFNTTFMTDADGYVRKTFLNTDGDISWKYYYKRINAAVNLEDPGVTEVANYSFQPQWVCAYGSVKATMKMTLVIDEGDFPGYIDPNDNYFNELGLYIAKPEFSHAETQTDPNVDIYNFRYPELFTHITFDPEPLHDFKFLRIDYYLFA